MGAGEDTRHGEVETEESKRNSSDTESSKRQKTEETSDATTQNSDKDKSELFRFFKLKSKVRSRNYRSKQDVQDEVPDELPVPGTSNGQENES